MFGEVAGDQRLSHAVAASGARNENVKTVGEASVNLVEVSDTNLPAYRGGAVGLGRFPKLIAGEISEWQVRVVPIIVFTNEVEASREGVAKFLTPWDAIRGGESCINQIKNRKQEKRLVRALMS